MKDGKQECWCDDHQMPCFGCYNDGRRELPEDNK